MLRKEDCEGPDDRTLHCGQHRSHEKETCQTVAMLMSGEEERSKFLGNQVSLM